MNIILFDEGVRHFDCADERFRHIRSVLHLGQGDEFSAGELNKSKGKAVIRKLSDEGLDFDYVMTSPAKKLAPLTVILASVRPICMKRILREPIRNLWSGFRRWSFGNATSQQSQLTQGKEFPSMKL